MKELGEFLSQVLTDLGKLRKASDEDVRAQIDPIQVFLAERLQAIAEILEKEQP